MRKLKAPRLTVKAKTGLVLLFIILLTSVLALVSSGDAALICRMTRSSMLEVIRQDYIRTARAKGVPDVDRQVPS